MNIAFALLQYLLPKHAISRWVAKLADSRSGWLKNRLIALFIRQFKVDMSEAVEPNPEKYPSFNAFFTRAIRPECRPLDASPSSILCPADGRISELGSISNGRLFQAKGHDYSLETLLGGDNSITGLFNRGSFATVYLSPRDYHRVHMPVAGRLRYMSYIPGALFSVNQATANHVDGLFARNERVVCLFDTEFGPMAIVLVGAMIVAAIETVWAGQITPLSREIRREYYGKPRGVVELAKGQEMGRFKLGSTAIVLFAEGAVDWQDSLGPGIATRMGAVMGRATGRVRSS